MTTFGYILLFNSGYYFTMLRLDVKRYILIAVFFSTCLLPVLTISVMALGRGFNLRMEHHTQRIKPLLFTAIYYYLGFYLLKGLPVYPVFRIILITSVVVIVVMTVISFKWKISSHMAAIGGVAGSLLAISFRMGMNPVWLLTGVFLTAGIVGSVRMYIGNHTLSQILAGFTLGLVILYLAVFYI